MLDWLFKVRSYDKVANDCLHKREIPYIKLCRNDDLLAFLMMKDNVIMFRLGKTQFDFLSSATPNDVFEMVREHVNRLAHRGPLQMTTNFLFSNDLTVDNVNKIFLDACRQMRLLSGVTTM